MEQNETYPQHPVYDKNTIEFVTVAAEYCAFIENCRRVTPKAFFDKSVKLLSLLYLKSSLLPDFDDSSFSDLQQFVTENVYENIRRQISFLTGQYDQYLEVFLDDMQYSDTPIVAYISEDLSDIYQDLKDMISNFQSADIDIMNDALIDCKDNFHSFWGQKLLNALRAMHNVLNSPNSEWEESEDDIDNIDDELYNTNQEIDFFDE